MSIFDDIANALKNGGAKELIETSWDEFVRPVKGDGPIIADLKSLGRNVVDRLGAAIDQGIDKVRERCADQTSQDAPYQEESDEGAPGAGNAPDAEAPNPTEL